VEEVEKWKKLSDGSHQVEEVGLASVTVVLTASERLRAIRSRVNEIGPSDDVRVRAIHLLSAHALRSADALQLAAALAWCEGQPSGETLVCVDQRLRKAATQEGFDLHPDTADA
jgi:predicted nucleic acid-binding protein